MRILKEVEWRELEKTHVDFVGPWIEAYRYRRARRQTHPVHDFLFGYYQMNRRQLTEWRPMSDMRLCGNLADRFLQEPTYRKFDDGVGVDARSIDEKDRGRVIWVKRLLENTLERSPQFGCYGMHEWAMLYKLERPRHETTPLRVSAKEIESVVETMPIRCTHHDAFRFFSPDAVPLNQVTPGREDREVNEQFGCVHFNMDLYRWSYKLSPLIGSELMDDCFRLAIAARELDMRASPYDVSQYGYEAIAIETPEGRATYREEQQAIYERGQPIARRLLEECNRLLGVEVKVA